MFTSPPLSSPITEFNGFSVYHHQEPPFQGKLYAHAFLEIILPLKPGHATVTWNDEADHWHEQSIQPEHLGIIPPYQSHTLTWHQRAELVLIYIEYPLLIHAAQEFLPQYKVELFGHYDIADRLLMQMCLRLCSALKQEVQVDLLYLDRLTTFLTIHLLQYYSSLGVVTYGDASPQLVPYKLKQAISYIQTHCCNSNIRITDVAVEIGLSQYHFSRLFKQAMGIPPHKYLNQQRIERAKTLLRQKDSSISEIATQVGFVDQSHFTKSFRQLTGRTPQAYRRDIW
ncbi:MAG: helix-turn-helix transcriptional regulator [Oculatellaceae cyanobacterium bins.114]|nr:helix-turn-helix transcriptional regulator [Oculatellaceae cyanobacterium bins.114]